MRIVPIVDLPTGWESQNVLLMHQAFGRAADPRRLGHGRAYPPYAEYRGLCALDGPRIVASLVVRRFPFRSRAGEQTCSGLGAVATLPTHRGRGLARRLIAEAHARERAAGSPFFFLFTGRSNIAHGLYERLGYRDVLEFPRAARYVPGTARRVPSGWRWRRATRTDRRTVERLHARRYRSAFGFTRRGIDWWPGPVGEFLLLRGGVARGYARLDTQGSIRASHEAVALDPVARSVLVTALERQVAGHWLLLGTGPLGEFRGTRSLRSYAVSPSSYGVLMATSLRGAPAPRRLRHALGIDAAEFAYGVADAF